MSKGLLPMREVGRTGLVWGAVWFGAGALIMAASLLVTGETGADVPYPLGFGALGFLAGAAFSLVLGKARGPRAPRELSFPFAIAVGAISGLLFAGAFTGIVALTGGGTLDLATVGLVFAGASAATAGLSLGLARRKDARGTGRVGSESG